MALKSRLTQEEEATILRILSHDYGDPDFEEDPTEFEPPPPLTHAERGAVERIGKRAT